MINLLLKFKEKSNITIDKMEKDHIYDFNLGQWINKKGIPSIKRQLGLINQTRITNTREGVDQSESSFLATNNSETLITDSGESIDRSENLCYFDLS